MDNGSDNTEIFYFLNIIAIIKGVDNSTRRGRHRGLQNASIVQSMWQTFLLQKWIFRVIIVQE